MEHVHIVKLKAFETVLDRFEDVLEGKFKRPLDLITGYSGRLTFRPKPC